ncbi:hypothetical protein DYB28_000452 [Aphanomyces astaci]|uniref:DDE-1 domain-containing protein n=1 Tax=Aphanomyces astaci TaxID=112090 RepID=A0A9X8E0P6_APHAT|nr:hypothetical protein DYB28_000452 [Aphanomyces astaci]
MTAVLTIRRDGLKLPILFIIKGEPGGLIEKSVFKTYPSGHYYAIQKKAWMDASRVEGESVLILDNFECHVSKEALETSQVVGFNVVPLPANATSHCQPLDVSIMAPFKRHLRDLWIAEDISEAEGGDQVPAKVKRITLINRAMKAWDMVTPEEVRGSFFKAIPKS